MGPEKRNTKGLRMLSAGLAIGFWELGARAIHNRLLLVGPIQTLTRLWSLLGQRTTWQAIAFTFSRIGLGFFLAFVLALILASLAAAFPWAQVLLGPMCWPFSPCLWPPLLSSLCCGFRESGSPPSFPS